MHYIVFTLEGNAFKQGFCVLNIDPATKTHKLAMAATTN